MRRLFFLLGIIFISSCSLNRYCPDVNSTFQDTQKEKFRWGKEYTITDKEVRKDEAIVQTASLEKPSIQKPLVVQLFRQAKLEFTELEKRNEKMYLENALEVESDTVPLSDPDPSENPILFNEKLEDLEKANKLADYSFWLALLVPLILFIPIIQVLTPVAIIAALITGNRSIKLYRKHGFSRGPFRAHFGKILSMVWIGFIALGLIVLIRLLLEFAF